jgi:hypothetical protein
MDAEIQELKAKLAEYEANEEKNKARRNKHNALCLNYYYKNIEAIREKAKLKYIENCEQMKKDRRERYHRQKAKQAGEVKQT